MYSSNVFRMSLLAGAFLSLAGVRAFAADPPPAVAAAGPTTKPVFMEDFESGTLDKSVWEERVTGGATVKVQQEKVAHGKSALQITYPPGRTVYGFVFANKLPESVKEHYFGRAYVYIDTLAAGHNVLIPSGTAGWPNANFLEVGAYRGTFQPSFQQNRSGDPRGETTKHGAKVAAGKWFCLEWEFNDKPDSINLWVDGEPVESEKLAFRTVNTDLVKGFSEVGFGLRVWGGVMTPVNVYYDDIAIGTERIGPIK